MGKTRCEQTPVLLNPIFNFSLLVHSGADLIFNIISARKKQFCTIKFGL